MKFLIFTILLFPIIDGFSQTPSITDFVAGDNVYHHNTYNAEGNLIYFQRNLSFINRIFNKTYTDYNGKNPGNINGEYLENYDAYIAGCSGCTHKGIDYKASSGTPIYALIKGKIKANANNSYGVISIYNSEKNISLLYLHCSSSSVAIDADVNVGDIIGETGNVSPDAIGAHLHIELRKGIIFNGNTPQAVPNVSNTYDPRIIDDLFPPRPLPTLPIQNGQVNATNVNFAWNAVNDATQYQIQISTTQTFATTIKDDNIGNNNSVVYSLQPNTEYFWRVKSNLTNGWDASDVVRRFLTKPNPPTMTSPTNNQTGVPTSVNFIWTQTVGSLSHRLQVSQNALLQITQVEDVSALGLLVNIPTSPALYPANNHTWTGAQPNTIYYWRLRVNTPKGTSIWKSGKFTTGSSSSSGYSVVITNNYTVNVIGNKLHYAFDNGNFNEIPFDNNADVFLPTDNLNLGYHKANFYFSDINNKRSSITQNTFVKVFGDTEDNTMEYWFDNSYATKQTLQFTDPSNIDLNANANNLTLGQHTINYRFQLQGGMWSSVHNSSFTKTTNANSTYEKIMEYWFDNGFENRQTASIANADNIDLNLSTTNLDLGNHTVYYRFKIGTEEWSSVAASSFLKLNNEDGITQMQYWFNNDFLHKKNIPIVNLNTVDENISTAGLPLGSHTLYTRFQKAGSMWSSVTATSFNKSTSTATNGWQYQYWVDSTLGFAKTINFNGLNDTYNFIDVSDADTGRHLLHSRFRFNGGQWSSVTADSFYKTTPTSICTITNSPSGEDSLATHFLCKNQIIIDNQDGIVNQNKMRRKDLAKITYRGLMGIIEPTTPADYYPSLFGDLQTENASNSYYFKAAKLLSYLDFQDGIPPFNPSRLNFHPEDTIVRGYVLKVLLEAWNIKPEPNMSIPYADVVQGTEVYGYVAKAAQMGIIKKGAGFENFRPYQAVTRIEAFVMLYRLLQITSKPEITEDDFYIPFLKDSIVGNNPGMGEGNFSSYSETPFTIKGVPSLSFTFNYNSALLEFPTESFKGRNDNGDLVYDQQNLGNGWNHNYNNYIVIDNGITNSTADNRYLIYWSNGNVQQYDINNNKYFTTGIYDVLTDDVPHNPNLITIKTKSQIVYIFQKLSGVSGNILHLVSIKDRHNNTVSLNYEDGYSAIAGINIKRLKEVDDSHDRKIVFTYQSNSNLIDSVSANAGTLHKGVLFEYTNAVLTKYYNPKNDFTTYTYGTGVGQQNLLMKITMPKGNEITNSYGASNKLNSSQVNNNLQTIISTKPNFTATDRFNDISITTISGNNTIEQQMRNNKYGMPVFTKGPNSKNGFEYNNTSNPLLPTKVVDSLTSVEVLPIYDNATGNLLSITKKAGIIIKDSMQYNTKNDIVKRIDPKLNETDFIYNTTGQLTQINAPDNVITKLLPNANGTVDSITNPSGIGTKFIYDIYGNVTETKLPLAITNKTVNDAYGKMLQSINANTLRTFYNYDENDNMLKEAVDTGGLNIITQYRFDKNDNLIEVENAKGNITYLTYNNSDQLVKEQFGSAIKQYSYDDDGRIKKYISPNNVQFINQFNAKDLLVNDGYATYDYYADNSLQKISKNNKSITYSYDALKRISNVNYNDIANNNVSYLYDANGNITRITYPNGFVVNYVYDANNRLTSVKDATNSDWASYTYLKDGRLETQTNRNGTQVKYFYDAAGRMDSMVNIKSDATIIAAYGFELDKLGNHKKESYNQPFSQTPPALNDSTTYSYNNVNRLLTRNAEAYGYDNNGNLTSRNAANTNVNYTYDVKNNLTNYANGNTIFSYEYDGLGQRRKKNNTRYVLDNANNVLAETDLSGNVLYFYIHGLGMIARVKAVNSQPYYYHYDFRGSTVAITNANQNLTHKYQYGAFGETEQVQEEDFNAYRYVGKYGVGYEAKDLTFMRARYYQPNVGRFNSEDPIWATNLYSYVDNNTIKNTDSKGQSIDQAKSYYDRNSHYRTGILNIEDLTDAISDREYWMKDLTIAWNKSNEATTKNGLRQSHNIEINSRDALNILSKLYTKYLSLNKPDETLNPFNPNIQFEVSTGSNFSNVFRIMKVYDNKKGYDVYKITVLKGSTVAQNSSLTFWYDSHTLKTSKNANGLFTKENGGEALNNILNGFNNY